MAASGTSNVQIGGKRWVAIDGAAAIDNLNIDSDNDTGVHYFMTAGRVSRLGFLATTSVTVSDFVKVEVYKNGTGGTLLGTWTVCLTGACPAAGEVTYAEAVIHDTDGEVAEDGATRYPAPDKMEFNAGEDITLKVVEPADAGAGIAYIEVVEEPVHPTSTNVNNVGTVA